MKPDYIITTKVYAIHHKEGAFKLYVSLHKDNYYYVGLSYYITTGTWESEEGISMDIRLENFRGTEENKVINEALRWMERNIPGEYKIELKETI